MIKQLLIFSLIILILIQINFENVDGHFVHFRGGEGFHRGEKSSSSSEGGFHKGNHHNHHNKEYYTSTTPNI
uniref:Uncharacterized protein n=1 Tax=Meloidogyne floridensis TaxID=298350 RepID=A0A915NKR6_9BILA